MGRLNSIAGMQRLLTNEYAKRLLHRRMLKADLGYSIHALGKAELK
jgi:hypothetical protein